MNSLLGATTGFCSSFSAELQHTPVGSRGQRPLIKYGEPFMESRRSPVVSRNFYKLLASALASFGILFYLYRTGGWRDIWKFLSSAFFVSAGVLFYLKVTGVSIPVIGTNFVETPRVSGLRAIGHSMLCVTCFYLGFIRKDSKR